ncbi:MAG: Origin recognition complex, subunit 1 [Claussenomyces sp. TS43310]|nr:MAG: Origin recognition complex, subunit 1 [Claussenomyces sp. TS43310]
MPHRTASQPSKHCLSKAERARRYLVGGTVARADSDDELGLEDHPWEWVFAEATAVVGPQDSCLQNSVSTEQDIELSHSNRRLSAIQHARNYTAPIIGARMGSFQCKVGDCVLLKAEGNKEAWVGLICEFIKGDEEEKLANFMWFSTEKEIRNKEKKRTDFLENELYITPSWDVNPLASVNGKALILSAEAYKAKYPMGKIPRSSRHYGKTFICRRGCNTRTATYTAEFSWEDIFHGSERDIHDLIQRVKRETKASRKRCADRNLGDEVHDFGLDEAKKVEVDARTPKKRQKMTSILTPQKQQIPSKLLTPTHKRVIVKKHLEFTPLGTRILSSSHFGASPFQIARSKLHVSAVPTTLPCREPEFAEIYSLLEGAITEGSGACIYISGTPGTGKTATVREVVAQLNAAVVAEDLDDFIFVEINGMKVTDPHHSYCWLWEALKGDRVSPTQALDLLEREFNHPSPRRVPCVVLMDELDQLVTKNQGVMYNFFNWPGLRHSRLIVLAVANTMDLPERTLSNKISSRLGMHRITFGGYNHEQLMKIIQSRLEGVPGSIVEADAVQFASRKVAAVSGDARRALDICRRAVELAETEGLDNGDLAATPCKGSSRGLALQRPERPDSFSGRVTIATIKRAIREVTTNPLQQHLCGLPLSSKLFLAALLATLRRTGLGESILGQVIEEARRIAKMTTGINAAHLTVAEVSSKVISGRSNGIKRYRRGPDTHTMGSAAIELLEAGIVGLETRRGDRTGKVRLCIGEEDIKQALNDDAEVKGFGLS